MDGAKSSGGNHFGTNLYARSARPHHPLNGGKFLRLVDPNSRVRLRQEVRIPSIGGFRPTAVSRDTRPVRWSAALLLALVLPGPRAAAADGCARGCESALRRCARDVICLTRPGQFACATEDTSACRADARALGAALGARCTRLAASCRGCCAAGGAHCGGATLEVDDPEGRGAPGDGRLSLTEALDLAAGRLAPSALDVRERRHVHGSPGAGHADRIRFARRLTAAIRRVDAPVVSVLPALDAGDAIIGGGTRLYGSSMGGVLQPGPGSMVSQPTPVSRASRSRRSSSSRAAMSSWPGCTSIGWPPPES
jgi:hypothetical protein